MKKKTLSERVKALETAVYGQLGATQVRDDVKQCPRCKRMGMNAWQKDICYLCAYVKGDPLV